MLVCINNRWGPLCYHNRDATEVTINNTRTVCSQLGYAGGKDITGSLMQSGRWDIRDAEGESDSQSHPHTFKKFYGSNNRFLAIIFGLKKVIFTG